MMPSPDKKFKLCILKNEDDRDHLHWVKACQAYSAKVEYRIIDLTSDNWLEELKEDGDGFDLFLAKPPGLVARFKQLYDERIYIMERVLRLPIYPTPVEIYIYENKRFLYSWLKANKLPHPATSIFYSKVEAGTFLTKTRFPVIGKAGIGASGSGVTLVRNIPEAMRYIDRAFSMNGIRRRWGPNLSKGNILRRGTYYIKHTDEIRNKVQHYIRAREDVQRGFVILQEYVPHSFEWRVVAIGDSYFAHKKLKIGKKASGSLLKDYVNPPLYLLDFVKRIMTTYRFASQAIDIFETQSGKLLINEMQCIFGQSDPYQMLIDGKPGRYRFSGGKWVFEEGNFNYNDSYNLRLAHVLQILNG